MNEMPPKRNIQRIRTAVVGVDGSAESLAALSWAARLIEPDGVVHAVAAISPVLELAIAAVQVDSAPVVDKLRRELDHDWTAALRTDGHHIVCKVVEDDPADALFHAAAGCDADLIVVGAHAKPPHFPRTIGRVTAKLVRQTDRPLAIVDTSSETSSAHGATVVAHADHHAATKAAVRWAAAFADQHDAGVTLLRSTPNRPSLGPDGLLDVLAFYLDPSMLRQWTNDDLAQLADDIQRSTERDLRITWSATTGPPGPRLIDAAAEPALIVVSSTTHPGGRHVVPAALRHVIIHAPCPVVVVPPDS
jgi:nucleotide-binding universal stress UspA family protein